MFFEAYSYMYVAYNVCEEHVLCTLEKKYEKILPRVTQESNRIGVC